MSSPKENTEHNIETIIDDTSSVDLVFLLFSIAQKFSTEQFHFI